MKKWFYLRFSWQWPDTMEVIEDEDLRILVRLQKIPFYDSADCVRMGEFCCRHHKGVQFIVEESAFRPQ